MAWKNYGDVNFFEHGGCQVQLVYTAEEIEEYPLLKSVYRVFYLLREGDVACAALCTVDIDDDWIDKKEIYTAIGLESEYESGYELDPDCFAVQCVQYYGISEFHPICLNNTFTIDDNSLHKWLKELDIKERSEI